MKRMMFVTVVAAAMSVSVFGAAIQFDFGALAGAYSGKIAPGYEASAQEPSIDGSTTITNLGGLGLMDSRDGTAWNASDNGRFPDPVYADNAPATGVTAQAARYNAATPAGLFMDNWQWSTAAYAPDTPSSTQGVQATALMQDELYSNQNAEQLLGFRVTGLPAGEYTMLVLGATPTAENRPHPVRAGLFANAAATDNLYWDDPAMSAVGVLGTGGHKNAMEWVEGQNYMTIHFTTAGTDECMVVMVSGFNAAMSGIQIIQVVPEPATMSLLALGGLAILRRRLPKGH